MKKIISALLAVLLCSVCIACSADKEEPADTETSAMSAADRRELKSYFRSLTKNYVTSDDGHTVTVTVPDFAALIDKLPVLFSVRSVSADLWQKLVAENPDLVKEYVLSVESADEDTVFEALWEQIGIDLFITVVGDMELELSDPYEIGGEKK